MKVLDCCVIREKELLCLKSKINKKFMLAVIQIGEFKENDIYLRSKKKLALEFGVELIEIKFNVNSTKKEIVDKILELNTDKNITGIMIQKPILSGFDYKELVNYIDYRKDVDGVTEINQEKLYIVPCTAKAVLKVFDYYKMNVVNKKIVIVGKSDLVGMPLYNILKVSNEVTLCDSKTSNLKEIIAENDIIISAIGKANYFNNSYFRKGQVIIDVGTNYLEGKLVGDVDFNSIVEDVLITPVPGGIGVLTPVYLFSNLYEVSKLNL